MRPNKSSLSLFVLMLVLDVAAVPLIGVQAQGNSRTFSETGKTVKGKFLQYWEGHGGLAQQGFPISEEIQETSDTNGKIYTVQYFERAVFELHPENNPPNDVLLQLLGGFLYGQKYTADARGEVPNNEPGSRNFTETSRRLGGVFLQYWTSHGGLAQQGFPISNEFMEKNDLDGKTYKVQYFERAVFELHPENKPPFNVLLSQLGTFRYRAKYGNVTKQMGGVGNQNTAPFPLKAGLALFQSVRANDGYYYIDLVDAADKQVATIASASGPADISDAVNIASDGMYMLKVQADAGWTVNVRQPTAAFSAPPASQKWSGHLSQATPLFSLKAGSAAFHMVSTNGKAGFKVELLDQNGVQVNGLADAGGNADVSTSTDIPADGVYILRVYSDGDWTITVQQ